MRLLRETLRLARVILLVFLAIGTWGACVIGAIWLCLNGFWFLGVPLVALILAAGITVMDEFA